jgi:uncharacterized protein (DUF58 family)
VSSSRFSSSQGAIATGGPARWWNAQRQRFFRHAPSDDRPVVLRHSRIYVLPTRRGLALLGSLAVMLLASLNYGLSLGFVVTFLVGGMAAAGLLHTFRNLAGLEIKPVGAGEAFMGGSLAYALVLTGGGYRREAIRVESAEAVETATVDVPAGIGFGVTLERTASTRGRLPLGRVTLSSEFPLGLWRGWAYVHFPLAGIVFPAPEIGAPPLPGGFEGSDAQAGGKADDADLAGLRSFVAGDSLSRVAWKAVARGRGWYTKQFEGSAGGGPVTLDWASMPAALDLEERLSRLTAWVLAAEHATRPFALRLPGLSYPIGKGRDHRRAVLTALALYKP